MLIAKGLRGADPPTRKKSHRQGRAAPPPLRVTDAITDAPEQAANLRARAELMQKIAERVKQHDWTQDEAARRCGVTQSRINDLLRGRSHASRWTHSSTSRTALGCRVRVDLEAA